MTKKHIGYVVGKKCYDCKSRHIIWVNDTVCSYKKAKYRATLVQGGLVFKLYKVR